MNKHSEFVQEWMSKIKAGLEYRKKHAYESKWSDYRKMYRGEWSEQILPVNRVFSYGRSMIPRTYFRAPRVVVTPTSPDLVWHARVVEAIDNMLIRETKLKSTIKRIILDAYLCGTGICKLGYDSEFGFIPDFDIGTGETVTQETKQARIEYNSTVKPGFPWALRVPPDDIVVPYGATDPDSLEWIAHRVIRPLEDVKADPKYKNTKDLKGTLLPNLIGRPFLDPTMRTEKDTRPYCELWEIRDARTKSVIVICEDKILLSIPDALQIESLPYEFLIPNADPEYFWGIPDVKILEPQQVELNDIRTQQSLHRRISLIKFLYLRDKIKPEELQKMLSAEVGPAVAIDDTENVNAAVSILQPHVPPDLSASANECLSDMREALGFSSNQLGEFSPYHHKTATESMIVNQAFEVRADERRDLVSDMIAGIISKFNQFIFKFWTSERVIQIVSPGGQPFWVSYTGEELAGEYHLHIDIESGLPMTRAIKYQMARELFAMFNGDPMVDQVMLRKIVLDNYESIDPQVRTLLNVPEGVDPRALAQARQPEPEFIRQKSSKVIPFEQLRSGNANI